MSGQGKKSNLFRWRYFAFLLTVIIASLVAGLFYLNTGAGQKTLVSWANRNFEEASTGIKLGEIEGSLFSGFNVSTITISDDEGVWLDIREVALRWSPLELLIWRVAISDMQVESIMLHRLPRAGAKEEEDEGYSLPSLWVDIGVHNFGVSRIQFGSDLVTIPTRLRSHGSLELTRGSNLLIRADIVNTGEVDEEIVLDIDYQAATEILAIDLNLVAPKGGSFARLAGIGAGHEVLATFNGRGEIEDWLGTLELKVDNVNIANATVQTAGAALAIHAKLDAGSFVPDDSAALFGRSANLSVELTPSARSDDTKVSLELVADTLRLNAYGVLNPADLGAANQINYTLEVIDARPFNRMLSAFNVQPFITKGVLRNIGVMPTIDLSVEGVQVSYDTVHTARLSGRLEATLIEGRVNFQLAGRMNHMEGEQVAFIRSYVDPGFNWQLEGRLDANSLNIDLTNVSLSNPLVDIRGSGQMLQEVGELDASFITNISSITPLVPNATGKLSATTKIARPNGAAPLQIDIIAATEALNLGQNALGALVGPKARLEARVISNTVGEMEVAGVRLSGKHFLFDGRAIVLPSQIIESSDFSLTAFNLDDVEELGGLAIDGKMEVLGRLSGPLASPALTIEAGLDELNVQGFSVHKFVTRMNVEDVLTAPHGQIIVAGETDLGPLTGQTGFSTENLNNITIPDVTFSVGPYRAHGAGTVSTLVPVSGSVTITTEDRELKNGGTVTKIDAQITLAGNNGDQQLEVSGAFSNLTLLVGDNQKLAIGAGNIVASALFNESTPLIAIEAALENFAHPRLQAQKILVAAKQDDQGAEYGVRLQGTRILPFDINITGESSIDAIDEPSHELYRVQIAGNIDGTRVETGHPVELLMDEAGFTIKPFVLHLGDGQIVGNVSVRKNRIQAVLEATQADLQPVTVFFPDIPITGALTGRLNFSAQPDSVGGDYAFTLSDGQIGDHFDNYKQDLDMSIEGRISDGAARMSGSIRHAEVLTGRFSIELPLLVDLSLPSVSIPDDQPLSGKLELSGDVSPIWPAFHLENHDLGGNIDATIVIGQTIASPDIDGRLHLREGRYENLQTGFVAADMEVVASIVDRHLVLESFVATDGAAGRLKATAAIDILPDLDVSGRVDLEMSKVRLIQQPNLDLVGSSTLVLEKKDSASVFRGKLTVENANVGALEDGGPEIVELEVREIYATGEEAVKAEAGAHQGPVALDLKVSAPGKVFIRSNGLDTEWKADLTLAGTSDQPIVAGTATLIRGFFDLAGKRFELTRGVLTFPNNIGNDPILDVTAELQLPDLEAILRIEGNASAPTLKVSSNPSLPQDEIMSRILFGASIAQLSAIDAVRLAAALRSFSTGRGPTYFDKVRRTIGFDRLSINTNESGADSTTVTGGKYLTDNIYGEVAVATDTGQVGGAIEVGVTRQLSVITRRTPDQDNITSLRWSWRY